MLGKVLHVILRKEMLQMCAIDIKVTKVVTSSLKLLAKFSKVHQSQVSKYAVSRQ